MSKNSLKKLAARQKNPAIGWPDHGEDEHSATTFQLTPDADHPKQVGRRFRYDVGDHIIYPLGKAVVTWLDEETGNCLVQPSRD